MMKYLVDAQLPRRLAKWIQEKGIEAVHTLDLPRQNETEDTEIIRIVSSDRLRSVESVVEVADCSVCVAV